jgi:antitoxin component YwqK of YwqJK toxin-antitoxin module
MKTVIFIFITKLISFSLFANDFELNKETGKVIPSYVGELKVSKGDVLVKNQNGFNPVKEGTRFKVNDVVVTQEKSFAKILMVDDSVFTIGPHSEVKIEKFDFQEKNERRMIINFIKGQFKGLVKNKAKEGDLILKTNLAIMGVRGTQFLINHHNKDKFEISEFAVTEGNVEIRDDNNTLLPLAASQKAVFIKDLTSGEGAREEKNLNMEEILSFKDEEAFMNYYDISSVDRNSPFYHLVKKIFDTHREIRSSTNLDDKAQRTQGNWRENLDKLNKKLKEYNSD